MSDDAWRGAIATHSSDRRGRPTLKDGQLRGGAVELAPLFRKAAQEEPQRFAHLGLQLSPKTNPVYFSALLGGLAEATLNEEYKVAVCQRVFEYARVECGRDIAKLLATANRPLPDDALDMLVRLAIETEVSEDEKWWLEDVGDDQFDLRSDIYTKGINTTRGRAALALGELIRKDGGYISRLEPVLSELVGVRSAAVGSCVAYALRTVAYHDQALGVDLFFRMDFSEERLLGTPHVHEFVRENVHGEFAKVRGLIVRMLRSAYPDLRRLGARLGCLAGFSHQDALELAEESRRGDIHQRRGSAEVAAVNISEPKCRPWCESALGDFFADDDPEVRKVAASCFRHIHEDDLATCGDLIGAFCNAPASEDDSFSLLRALKNARAQLPGMTHRACERLLKRTERRGTDTMTAIELVFRLYQQHPNDKWTKRCLDLIDLVCLEEPGWACKGFPQPIQQPALRHHPPQKLLHRQAPDAVHAQAVATTVEQGGLRFRIVLAERPQPAQILGFHAACVLHLERLHVACAVDHEIHLHAAARPPEVQLGIVARVRRPVQDAFPVDQLVRADALDDLRGLFGFRSALGEQGGRPKGRLGGGETDLGAELDEQQVHQEAERQLEGHINFRHVALPGLRSRNRLRRFHVRVGIRAEGEVPRHEPHHVVATDALLRLAAFVDAVRLQQPALQVAEAGAGDGRRAAP